MSHGWDMAFLTVNNRAGIFIASINLLFSMCCNFKKEKDKQNERSKGMGKEKVQKK